MFFSVSYIYNNPNSRLLYGTHRNSHLLYGCYLLVHIWLNRIAFCHMAQCSHVLINGFLSQILFGVTFSYLRSRIVPFVLWEISALFLYDDDRVGYSIFCYMYSEHNYILSCYEENFPVVCGEHTTHLLHCPKSNPNFRDITWNVKENEVRHEIFRVLSCFLHYI